MIPSDKSRLQAIYQQTLLKIREGRRIHQQVQGPHSYYHPAAVYYNEQLTTLLLEYGRHKTFDNLQKIHQYFQILTRAFIEQACRHF